MINAGDDQIPLSDASTYLRFLPAFYASSETAGDPPFVALYLKIFEKLLSGIEDGALLAKAPIPLSDFTIGGRSGLRELLDPSVIGNLFYPRWSFLFTGEKFSDESTLFMPPLSEEKDGDKQETLFNALGRYFGMPEYKTGGTTLSPVELWARSFLQWLGETIGLKIDKNWSIDSSRTIIAKTPAFERARGTPMGLEWLLDACLAACPQPIDGVTLTAKATVSECVRQALIVCDDTAGPQTFFVVRDSYPDPENAVIISDIVGPKIRRDGITIDVDSDGDPVGYVPWRFEVQIDVSVQGQPTHDLYLYAAMRMYARVAQAVLDAAKPALTTYVLNIGVDSAGNGGAP
jgi:hypothetical protein